MTEAPPSRHKAPAVDRCQQQHWEIHSSVNNTNKLDVFKASPQWCTAKHVRSGFVGKEGPVHVTTDVVDIPAHAVYVEIIMQHIYAHVCVCVCAPTHTHTHTQRACTYNKSLHTLLFPQSLRVAACCWLMEEPT